MLNIQENISLAQFSSFRIGGPARFFVEVSSVEEIREALSFAREKNLEIFVLGGGTNVLVSDRGFDGLVIRMRLIEFELDKKSGKVKAGAGVFLAKIINDSANNGLSGLEWGAGIPGTIGGAVRGNAGAFGGEIGDIIENVLVVDILDGNLKNFEKAECKFGYRNSIFKENKNLLIVFVELQLRQGDSEESKKRLKEIILKRMEKQPKGGSAGSFFINPKVDNLEILEEFEEEAGMKSKEGKIPAGWLISMAGLQGKSMGGAMVSPQHANYIVNTGNAKAEDVIMLSSYIKQQIRDRFGVELMEEVQLVGF